MAGGSGVAAGSGGNGDGGGSLCVTAASVATCLAAIGGGGAGDARVIPHAPHSPATAAKASGHAMRARFASFAQRSPLKSFMDIAVSGFGGHHPRRRGAARAPLFLQLGARVNLWASRGGARCTPRAPRARDGSRTAHRRDAR